MHYATSPAAIAIFAFFVAVVLAISFSLGKRARSAKGYYAAHGEVHPVVNGIAFAGDYLSAASFLGICGMIAFYGYDGFLYSIGYLAGWVVALFVIAEPVKRLGKFTFADAMDSRFNSVGIKLMVAIATLVVSIFYLIPQMVGAGALVRPLLGLPHWAGVVLVGGTVTVIVVTAGMLSTTWVQFIKGSLLVVFCFILTVMILNRGLSTHPAGADASTLRMLPARQVLSEPGVTVLAEEGGWKSKPYVRTQSADGTITVWRKPAQAPDMLYEAQLASQNRIQPIGRLASLPGGQSDTGALGPLSFLSTMQQSTVVTWSTDKIHLPNGKDDTVYYPSLTSGADLLRPGGSPTFASVRKDKLSGKLDFFSLMLALFCGTASLPHILIRYYTVKDQASARLSTVVGIATIGFFYILTLYLGLGAMTCGALDPTDSNMAAPLLAKSFNNYIFAIISAVAFTTVLGTVSGLIMAASGAVAHDLIESVFKVPMDDHAKVFYGRVAAVAVAVFAMILGIAFQHLPVAFLVGWAFNIAASANLPSLVMLLFWKRTTKQGIIAAVTIGMLSSLIWILLSQQCYKDVYHTTAVSIVPFSQPGLVTIPLGFVVVIVVSLMTGGRPASSPQR